MKLLKVWKKPINIMENRLATDGLCELSCPVDIDTGKLIKHIEIMNKLKQKNNCQLDCKSFFICNFKCKNWFKVLLDLFQNNWSQFFLESISNKLHYISKNKIPLWNKAIPLGAKFTAVNKIDKQLTKKQLFTFQVA